LSVLGLYQQSVTIIPQLLTVRLNSRRFLEITLKCPSVEADKGILAPERSFSEGDKEPKNSSGEKGKTFLHLLPFLQRTMIDFWVLRAVGQSFFRPKNERTLSNYLCSSTRVAE